MIEAKTVYFENIGSENTDEVLVVNTVSRQVVDKVTVGKHPFGVTLSPDERRMYVSNRWDDNVSVVDTDSMKVTQTFPVGDDPHGLVTDVTGNHLYVTNLSTDDISVIETKGLSPMMNGNAPQRY